MCSPRHKPAGHCGCVQTCALCSHMPLWSRVFLFRRQEPPRLGRRPAGAVGRSQTVDERSSETEHGQCQDRQNPPLRQSCSRPVTGTRRAVTSCSLDHRLRESGTCAACAGYESLLRDVLGVFMGPVCSLVEVPEWKRRGRFGPRPVLVLRLVFCLRDTVAYLTLFRVTALC